MVANSKASVAGMASAKIRRHSGQNRGIRHRIKKKEGKTGKEVTGNAVTGDESLHQSAPGSFAFYVMARECQNAESRSIAAMGMRKGRDTELVLRCCCAAVSSLDLEHASRARS